MEVNRPKRILVSLDAEILLDDRTIPGFISNLSENGVFIRTDTLTTDAAFQEGSRVTLRFKLPSGDTVTMPCTISWAKKSQSNNGTYSIGMEILDCSQPYKEFITGRTKY